MAEKPEMSYEQISEILNTAIAKKQNKQNPTTNTPMSREEINAMYGLNKPKKPSLVKEMGKSAARGVTGVGKLATRAAQGAALDTGALFGVSPEENIVSKGLGGAAKYLDEATTGEGALARNPEFEKQHPVLSLGQDVVEGAAPWVAAGAATELSGGTAAPYILPALAGLSHQAESTERQMERGVSGNEALARSIPGAALNTAAFALMPKALGKLKGNINPVTKEATKGVLPGFLGEAGGGVTKGVAKGLAADAPYLLAQGEASQGMDVAAGAMTPEEWQQGHTPEAIGKNLLHTAVTGGAFGGLHGLHERVPKNTAPIVDNKTATDILPVNVEETTPELKKQGSFDFGKMKYTSDKSLEGILPEGSGTFPYAEGLKKVAELKKMGAKPDVKMTIDALGKRFMDISLPEKVEDKIEELSVDKNGKVVRTPIYPFMKHEQSEMFDFTTDINKDIPLKQQELDLTGSANPLPEQGADINFADTRNRLAQFGEDVGVENQGRMELPTHYTAETSPEFYAPEGEQLSLDLSPQKNTKVKSEGKTTPKVKKSIVEKAPLKEEVIEPTQQEEIVTPKEEIVKPEKKVAAKKVKEVSEAFKEEAPKEEEGLDIEEVITDYMTNPDSKHTAEMIAEAIGEPAENIKAHREKTLAKMAKPTNVPERIKEIKKEKQKEAVQKVTSGKGRSVGKEKVKPEDTIELPSGAEESMEKTARYMKRYAKASMGHEDTTYARDLYRYLALHGKISHKDMVDIWNANKDTYRVEDIDKIGVSKDPERNQLGYQNRSIETLYKALQSGVIDAIPSKVLGDHFVTKSGTKAKELGDWYMRNIKGTKTHKTKDISNEDSKLTREKGEISVTKADVARIRAADKLKNSETKRANRPHTIYHERLVGLKRDIIRLNGVIAKMKNSKEKRALAKELKITREKFEAHREEGHTARILKEYNKLVTAIEKAKDIKKKDKLNAELRDLKKEARDIGRLELEDKLINLHEKLGVGDRALAEVSKKEAVKHTSALEEASKTKAKIDAQHMVDNSFIDTISGFLTSKKLPKDKVKGLQDALDTSDIISDNLYNKVKKFIKSDYSKDAENELYNYLVAFKRSTDTTASRYIDLTIKKLPTNVRKQEIIGKIKTAEEMELEAKQEANLKALKEKKLGAASRHAERLGKETYEEGLARRKAEDAERKAKEAEATAKEEEAKKLRIEESKAKQAEKEGKYVPPSAEEGVKFQEEFKAANPFAHEDGYRLIFNKKSASAADVKAEFQKYLNAKSPEKKLIAQAEVNKKSGFVEYWASKKGDKNTPLEFSERRTQNLKPTGNTVKDIRKVIKSTDVRVLQSMKDVPTDMLASMREHGVKGIRGLFDRRDGKIYLIADHIENTAQAVHEVFYHELTHKGLQNLGPRGEQLLKQIYMAHRKEIEAMGTFLSKDKTSEARLKATNEFVARFGATNLKPTLWAKVKNFIKDTWASIVGKPLADKDLRDLMNEVSRATQAESMRRLGEQDYSVVGEKIKSFKEAFDPSVNEGIVKGLTKYADEHFAESGLVKTAIKGLIRTPYWVEHLREATTNVAKSLAITSELKHIFRGDGDENTSRVTLKEVATDYNKMTEANKANLNSALVLGDKLKKDFKTNEELFKETGTKLTSAEFKLYRQTRDFIDQSWKKISEQYARTLAYTITDNVDMLAIAQDMIMNPNLKTKSDFQDYFANHRNIRGVKDLNTIVKEIDLKGIIAQLVDPEGIKKDYATFSREYGTKGLEGYIPRERLEGAEWIVEVKNGDRPIFNQAFYTKAEADKVASDIKVNPTKYFPENHKAIKEGDTINYLPSRRIANHERFGFKADTEIADMVSKALKDTDVTDKNKKDIIVKMQKEMINKLLAQHGKQHTISRKEHLIEGYDEDSPLDSIETMLNRTAHSFSKMRYMKDQMELLSNADVNVKPEIKEYINNTLRPVQQGGKAAQTLKNSAAIYFMGFRPLTALMQMAQLHTVGAAELGMHLGTAGIKTPAQLILAKAGKDVIFENLTPQEVKILRRADAAGITFEHSSQASLFQNLDDRAVRSQLGKRLVKVSDAGMWMFQKAETQNRRAAILAAYRVFSKTMGEEAAFSKAMEFNNNTNFMLNKGNIPYAMMHNPIGMSAYTLMSYTLNMTNWIMNRAHGSLSDTGIDAKTQRIALMKLLGYTAVLGGMSGLPFADDLNKVIRSMFGKDLKFETENFIKQNMGEDISSLIVDGVFAPTAGVSISSNMALRMPFVSGLLDDKSLAESAFGASGAMVGKVTGATKAAWRGEGGKVLENLAPEFASGAMRATRLANEGQRNASGQPVMYQGKPFKLSTGEAIAQGALGLKSERRAKVMRTMDTEYKLKSYWDDEKKLAEKKTRQGDKTAMQDFNRRLLKDKTARLLVKPITGSIANTAKPNVGKTQLENM